MTPHPTRLAMLISLMGLGLPTGSQAVAQDHLRRLEVARVIHALGLDAVEYAAATSSHGESQSDLLDVHVGQLEGRGALLPLIRPVADSSVEAAIGPPGGPVPAPDVPADLRVLLGLMSRPLDDSDESGLRDGTLEAVDGASSPQAPSVAPHEQQETGASAVPPGDVEEHCALAPLILPVAAPSLGETVDAASEAFVQAADVFSLPSTAQALVEADAPVAVSAQDAPIDLRILLSPTGRTDEPQVPGPRDGTNGAFDDTPPRDAASGQAESEFEVAPRDVTDVLGESGQTTEALPLAVEGDGLMGGQSNETLATPTDAAPDLPATWTGVPEEDMGQALALTATMPAHAHASSSPATQLDEPPASSPVQRVLNDLAALRGQTEQTEPSRAPWGGKTVALDSSRLEGIRGGFVTDTGLKLSFGIERAIYINGTLVTTTSLNVSDLSQLSAGQAAAVTVNGGALAVVQSGVGNTFLPGTVSGSTLGTVIQNTLDNQKIQNVTTVNATVNSGDIVRSLNLQNSVQNAITNSIRR